MMKPRNMLARTLIVLVISSALGVVAYDVARSLRPIVRVVDGDTIVISGERVRLFGLDCAERHQFGGPEAKRALEEMLAGRRVEIKPIERDRYQRTVARVFADGLDITALMIRSGVCREYCRYSKNSYGTCK